MVTILAISMYIHLVMRPASRIPFILQNGNSVIFLYLRNWLLYVLPKWNHTVFLFVTGLYHIISRFIHLKDVSISFYTWIIHFIMSIPHSVNPLISQGLFALHSILWLMLWTWVYREYWILTLHVHKEPPKEPWNVYLRPCPCLWFQFSLCVVEFRSV